MPRKPTETIILKGGCDKCLFYSYDDWGAQCSAGCDDKACDEWLYEETPPPTCPLRKKNIKVTYA